MVITIPAPLVVQGHEKQIGALKRFQDVLPVGIAGESVTQRPAELVKNGRFQQKFLHIIRLLLQHLLHQIIQHKAVAAGEGADEIGRVGLVALQGERRQLQPGNPAFGARFQGGDVGGGKVEAHDLVEENGRFLHRKAQIGRAQLGKLAAHAQAGQRQVGVLAGGDDQVQLRRQVLQQEGEQFVNRVGIYLVVVIQHQHEGVRHGSDFVEQRG